VLTEKFIFIGKGKTIRGEKMREEFYLQVWLSVFALIFGLLSVAGGFVGHIYLVVIASLPILIGGLYGLYNAYHKYRNHLRNFVARLGIYNDVYYDDKGLYYDKPGKPYLLKWDEVVDYRILDVVARNEYVGVPPLVRFIEYSIWNDIDPEYAMTGIMKIATIQFIKKDGSSIILQNVLSPYRLIPIFDKYIKGNNQKQGYHI
jgi:hypothetical protein